MLLRRSIVLWRIGVCLCQLGCLLICWFERGRIWSSVVLMVVLCRVPFAIIVVVMFVNITCLETDIRTWAFKKGEINFNFCFYCCYYCNLLQWELEMDPLHVRMVVVLVVSRGVDVGGRLLPPPPMVEWVWLCCVCFDPDMRGMDPIIHALEGLVLLLAMVLVGLVGPPLHVPSSRLIVLLPAKLVDVGLGLM